MFKPTIKILIVDDFAIMRKILKKTLNDLGYANTLEASNGQEAYQILAEKIKTNEPIEFIILDWNMPVMSGIELLKKCRSEEAFKKLPIMFVTAEGEESQIMEAVNMGVTEYIVKPFTIETLKEKLENVFKKQISLQT